MTESQWHSCDEPMPMLEFIRNKTSERKLRLFAVACCRRIWHLLPDERSRTAVEVAERFADGAVHTSELFEAHVAAGEVAQTRQRYADQYPRVAQELGDFGLYAASMAAERASSRYPIGMSRAEYESALLPPSRFGPGVDTVYGYAAHAFHVGANSEFKAQATLIREIFGNPFCENFFDPVWITSTVFTLSRQIYDSQDYSLMPILADALQDANCNEYEILNHCRLHHEHSRGCWVVDCLLSRS
jgi:hypothetical protein